MKKIEETFYSYATGNIYYTIQKNYNEVKSSTSLVCAVFNFLKSNMQNTLYPSSFSQPPCVYRGFRGWWVLFHPSSPFITLHQIITREEICQLFCSKFKRKLTFRNQMYDSLYYSFWFTFPSTPLSYQSSTRSWHLSDGYGVSRWHIL